MHFHSLNMILTFPLNGKWWLGFLVHSKSRKLKKENGRDKKQNSNSKLEVCNSD